MDKLCEDLDFLLDYRVAFIVKCQLGALLVQLFKKVWVIAVSKHRLLFLAHHFCLQLLTLQELKLLLLYFVPSQAVVFAQLHGLLPRKWLDQSKGLWVVSLVLAMASSLR